MSKVGVEPGPMNVEGHVEVKSVWVQGHKADQLKKNPYEGKRPCGCVNYLWSERDYAFSIIWIFVLPNL